MKPSIPPKALGAAVAASLFLTAAGCGGDDGDDKGSGSKPEEKSSEPAPSGGAKVALAADPGGKIAFDKKSLSAKAGKTTIDFTNESQVPHAVEVEGKGVEEETKTIQGGKASVTVDLKPGNYTFYCPVGDHEQEGMKGTLTVR